MAASALDRRALLATALVSIGIAFHAGSGGAVAAEPVWREALKRAGARHHRRKANGLDMHYIEAGQGPPVVLLHGWPFTSFSWRKTIPALASRYRVIAPDLRGYGETEKPTTGYDKRTMARDVLELCRGLGIGRIALIGHDRGARVATRFAKDHPEVIDRLVVIDNIPTVYVAERVDARLAAKYWIFFFNQVPDLPEALISGREDIWIRYFARTWSYDPHFLSEKEIAEYVRAYAQPGALRGGFADYRAGGEDVAQDRADRHVKISCPTLALWGREFELVGGLFDVAAVWSEFASNLTAIPVPFAGHMPHEEQPDFVNAELVRFLESWRG
jgi:pimeloyl-ACP methyl ester carboxylesterase